jgi:hypothetical protein
MPLQRSPVQYNVKSEAKSQDLVQASKAIFDQVKLLLDAKIKELEANFQIKELELSHKMATIFEKALESRLASFTSDYDKKMYDMSQAYLQKTLTAQKASERKALEMHHTYNSNVSQVKSLLECIKTMPIPQVNLTVPEHKAPDVIINVPEMKPVFNTPELNPIFNSPEISPIFNMPEIKPTFNVQVPEQKVSDVFITVPEQKLPDFHVNVPELKLPQVTVNVPPQKLIRKKITYSDSGYPVEVVEEEVKDSIFDVK